CVKNEFVITSGMALGIDTEAHKASLDFGTIGVLAGGIDSIYPPQNTILYHSIKEKGLLISERPIGTKPSVKLFPKRNNIIAALGSAVLVIESIENSGALLTANSAKKYNKPIFAVPGFPLDEKYKGNNYLIKNGANILMDMDDILLKLKTVNEDISENKVIFEDFTDEDQKLIWNLISYSPTNINELCLVSGISINKILPILIEMEICNIVCINPDNSIYKIN
ncbi:MAG: DNA-processing protein DprA, partial [Bacteroidota bacterium]